MYACTHTHARTCTHARAQTCTRTHTDMHTHAHTHLAQLRLESVPLFSLVGELQISDKEGKRITTTADEDTTSHNDSQPPGIFLYHVTCVLPAVNPSEG